jgi:hypothetical protein
MAKPHFVKRARKDYPDEDIKAGDSYWWWTFPHIDEKYYSKTEPRPSHLTSSEFWGGALNIFERLADLKETDDVVAALREAANDLESLGEGCDERLGSMPEGLQSGGVGMLLEERASACDDTAAELGSQADDIEQYLSKALPGNVEEYLTKALAEIQDITLDCD